MWSYKLPPIPKNDVKQFQDAVNVRNELNLVLLDGIHNGNGFWREFIGEFEQRDASRLRVKHKRGISDNFCLNNYRCGNHAKTIIQTKR